MARGCWMLRPENDQGIRSIPPPPLPDCALPWTPKPGHLLLSWGHYVSELLVRLAQRAAFPKGTFDAVGYLGPLLCSACQSLCLCKLVCPSSQQEPAILLHIRGLVFSGSHRLLRTGVLLTFPFLFPLHTTTLYKTLTCCLREVPLLVSL